MAPAGAMLFAISANDIALFAKGYRVTSADDWGRAQDPAPVKNSPKEENR